MVPKKIFGIERDILQSMIAIIRKCFPAAMKTNLYVETKSRLTDEITSANVRDALYHFYNILCDDTLSYEQRKIQINNAEEHFRRAIIEPYELLADNEIAQIREKIPDYHSEFVSREKQLGLEPVLTPREIDEKLNEFADNMANGRETKNRSVWDDNWEEATMLFISVFKEASVLNRELELLIKTGQRAKEIEISEQNLRLIKHLEKKLKSSTIIGVLVTIIVGIIGFLLGWILV